MRSKIIRSDNFYEVTVIKCKRGVSLEIWDDFNKNFYTLDFDEDASREIASEIIECLTQ
jgi:hypothetical protein